MHEGAELSSGSPRLEIVEDCFFKAGMGCCRLAPKHMLHRTISETIQLY